jgi:hypothetical protein
MWVDCTVLCLLLWVVAIATSLTTDQNINSDLSDMYNFQ